MMQIAIAGLLAAMVLAQSKAEPLELRVTMISLGVKEMDRSARFYNETLQLPLIGKPGDVTLVRAGDVTIVLNAPLGRGGKEIAGAVEVIFPVVSVAAGRAELGARGCKFVAEPHEVTPGMWAATFSDPDGHWLTLIGAK